MILFFYIYLGCAKHVPDKRNQKAASRRKRHPDLPWNPNNPYDAPSNPDEHPRHTSSSSSDISHQSGESYTQRLSLRPASTERVQLTETTTRGTRRHLHTLSAAEEEAQAYAERMHSRQVEEENRLLERQWRQSQGEIDPDSPGSQSSIHSAYGEPGLYNRPSGDFHKDRWVDGVINPTVYQELQEWDNPYGNQIPLEEDEHWVALTKESAGLNGRGFNLRSARVSSKFEYYDFLAILQVEIGRPLRYEHEDKKVWFDDKEGYQIFKSTWKCGDPIYLAYVEVEEERQERLGYQQA